MSLELSKSVAIRPAQHQERRSVRRKPTEIVVEVIAPDGTASAEIRDVSIHGCSLVFTQKTPRLGQIVKIQKDEIGQAAGIIRWVRANAAGVEFLRPLSPTHGLFGARSARS